MANSEELSEALVESLSEFNDVLKRRQDSVRDGQSDTAEHEATANEDHQVTAEQVGAGNLRNYPIAQDFLIDEGTSSEHYVDLAGAIRYVRNNLNLARIVSTGAPISPIGGVSLNLLRPKLEGGNYVNAYAIPRRHRHFQMKKAGDAWTDPLVVDVEIDSNDLTLSTDLENVTDYVWRYQDYAEDGETGGWQEAQFTTQYEAVLTPSITVTGGTTEASIRPVFQGSPFEVSVGSDTHTASQWKLYVNGNSLLRSETVTSGDLTQWSIDPIVLELVREYRVELQYIAESYDASGVASLTFTTQDGRPKSPNVVIPADLNGPFSIGIEWRGTVPQDINNDRHVSSTVEIYSDSSYTDLVVAFVDTEDQKTSVYLDNLADQTRYYLKARVKGHMSGYSDWSAYSFETGVSDGQATEISTQDSDVEIVAGDTSSYQVLVGSVTASPPQPLMVIKQNTGIMDTFRFDGVFQDGKFTDVCFDSGAPVIVGHSEDGTTSWITKVSIGGNVLWSQTLDGGSTTVLKSVISYADFIYAVGYSDGYNQSGQMGTSGLIVKLDATTGEVLWTRSYGGSGDDRFLSIYINPSYLFVVGDQRSDSGSGAAGTTFSSLVTYDHQGEKLWARHQDAGGSVLHFNDVVQVGANIFCVGRVGNFGCIFVYKMATGELVSSHRIHRPGVEVNSIREHDNRFYISGRLVGATFFARFSYQNGIQVDWVVSDNQSLSQGGFLLVQRWGSFPPMPEVIAPTDFGGVKGSVILRVPPNGTVAPFPYTTESVWSDTTGSMNFLDVTGQYGTVANIGPWSAWNEVPLSRDELVYNTNQPDPDAGDIQAAEDLGYGTNTTTKETKDLTFRGGARENYNYTQWVKQSDQSTLYYGTSNSNAGPEGGGSLEGLLPNTSPGYRAVAGNPTFYAYSESNIFHHYGSSQWYSKNFYQSTKEGNAASQYAAHWIAVGWQNTVTQSGRSGDYHWVAELISTDRYMIEPKNPEGIGIRARVKVRLKYYLLRYRWRLPYTIEKQETRTGTRYRWNLAFDERTRTYVPVQLPHKPIPTLPFQAVTPNVTHPTINSVISNF